MSSRNMRKVYGEKALPPPDDSSDEELTYSKVKPSFQGLEIASEDSASEPASSSEQEQAPPEPVKKKRNNKKKKKLAKSSSECGDLDEVERSVLEVNQILGEPAPAQHPPLTPADTFPPFLLVELRHINANNEMKRMFGPDEADKERRRFRQTNIRLLKKFIVVPLEDYVDMFKPVGLTMSVSRKEGGVTYFTFDHGPEYQRIHRRFLDTSEVQATRNASIFLNAQRNHHVEAMIECADFFFSMEDNTNGSEFVKQTVAYLQYVAHPSFLPVDTCVRLEYSVVENRIFHIAILKYIYLLTTKACHRTALELAKMMLNLDPSDPLAVLLVIDTLALRAWEHEWLLQAIDHWRGDRGGVYMYNLRFSYALAKFHVLTKNKQDITEATQLLEDALLDFPTVCHQMLRAASQRIDARLATHPLYGDEAILSTDRALTELTRLYCHMSWSKWNEPNVMKWFVKTCTELAEKFDTQHIYKIKKQAAARRRCVYRQMPDQVHRHMCVITAMAELVADNAVPVARCKRAGDPRPPANTVDRYGYAQHGRGRAPTVTPFLEVALGMLTSMDPRNPPPAPPRGLP